MNLRIFRKVKDAIILDKAVGYRMEKDFLAAIYLIWDQYPKYIKKSKNN